MHVLVNDVNNECEKRTFLYNALHAKHKVNVGEKHADFWVDKTYNFTFMPNLENKKVNPSIIYAVDDVRLGLKNEIPVWLMGFLY